MLTVAVWLRLMKTRPAVQLIFKNTQRHEWFLHLVIHCHFLEKLMSCQSHRIFPVCKMRRSTTVSRRSNRTLVEPWPNHHCGYFCNGRFHVRLSVQHSCICIRKTNTERQLLTTQVLIEQNSRKYYRCPCRGNQTVAVDCCFGVASWWKPASLQANAVSVSTSHTVTHLPTPTPT